MPIILKQICYKIKPNSSQISFRKHIFPQNQHVVARAAPASHAWA
jgi:hypothetical protein